jgi:hypothetical protein
VKNSLPLLRGGDWQLGFELLIHGILEAIDQWDPKCKRHNKKFSNFWKKCTICG